MGMLTTMTMRTQIINRDECQFWGGWYLVPLLSLHLHFSVKQLFRTGLLRLLTLDNCTCPYNRVSSEFFNLSQTNLLILKYVQISFTILILLWLVVLNMLILLT